MSNYNFFSLGPSLFYFVFLFLSFSLSLFLYFFLYFFLSLCLSFFQSFFSLFIFLWSSFFLYLSFYLYFKFSFFLCIYLSFIFLFHFLFFFSLSLSLSIFISNFLSLSVSILLSIFLSSLSFSSFLLLLLSFRHPVILHQSDWLAGKWFSGEDVKPYLNILPLSVHLSASFATAVNVWNLDQSGFWAHCCHPDSKPSGFQTLFTIQIVCAINILLCTYIMI